MTRIRRWLSVLPMVSAGIVFASLAHGQIDSVELIPQHGVVTGPAGSNYLSPDGSHIVTTWDDRFRNIHADGDRIYIYNIDAQRYAATVDLPYRLCEPGQLAVSDRAEFVAFCQRNGSSVEYWLYDTMADSMRVLIALDDDALQLTSRLAISPDGAVVGFVTSSPLDDRDNNDAPDVYTLDTASDLLRLASVDHNGDAIGNVETFTLNGRGRLVFRHQSELRLLGPRGISRRHFTVAENADANLLISRNQRTAIYTVDDNEKIMASFVDRPPEVIDGPNLGCRQLSMAPSRSGRFVAVRWRCPSGTSIIPFFFRTELIDTQADGRRVRAHTVGLSQLQLSDSGNALLIQGEELVWLFDRRRRESKPMWLQSAQSLPPPSDLVTYFGDGSLSPDGGYSVTPITNGFRIYDIQQQRHTQTVSLPNTDCTFPTYALSHMAEKIVVCRMNGFKLQYWLYDTTDRTLRRLVSYTPNGDSFTFGNNALQLSPDGNYMGFVTTVQLSERDTNATADVYLIDTRTRELSLASVDLHGFAMGIVKTFTVGNNAKLAFVTGIKIRRFFKNAGSSGPWIDLPPTAGQGSRRFQQNFRISRNMKVALFPNGLNGEFMLAHRSGAPNQVISAPQDSCEQVSSDLSANGQRFVLTWLCIQEPGETVWHTDIFDTLTGSRARLHTRYITYPEISDNGKTMLYRGDEIPWIYYRSRHRSEPMRLIE